MERRIPMEPFSPGEYLADEMEARGWTQEDLAEILGRSRGHVNRLVQGKTAITPETAHELASAFKIRAEEWMNLQMSYELALAAKETRDIAQRADLYSKAPIKDMIRRGWIAASKSIEQLESSLCTFFKVASIDDAPCIRAAAKKSSAYSSHTPAQVAWFCRVRQLAECVMVSAYSSTDFEAMIAELRKLAAYPEDARRIPRMLADFGVRMVIVEHLPKTKVDGGALWLDDASPVVALSLRIDRISNLWHTLIHELVHIKYRDEPAIDIDLMGTQAIADLPPNEQRANAEAADYLIPKGKLDSFITRTKPLYYQTKIVQFAQARGVHPGIVVGQLQHKGELEWSQLGKLVSKIRAEIVGQALTDGWGATIPIKENG